jgi:hypothetical protein
MTYWGQVLEIATLTPGLATRSAGRRETDIGLRAQTFHDDPGFCSGASWRDGSLSDRQLERHEIWSIGIFGIAGDSSITNV